MEDIIILGRDECCWLGSIIVCVTRYLSDVIFKQATDLAVTYILCCAFYSSS